MNKEKEKSSIDMLKKKTSELVVKKGVKYAVKGIKANTGIPSFGKPDPYLFKGGNPADYIVDIGKSGTWSTRHIESGKVIQSTMPGFGGNMLGALTLGVGLVNMGLGIYNAYQGGKIRSSLSEIQEVLRVQGRMLEILDAKQDSILEGLALLRQEMHQGFSGVQQTLQDQDALRKRELYEEKTYKLLRAYQDFIDMDFDEEEGDILRNKADDLEGWLVGQMKSISKRDPRYFPWLVALVFARRARIDVFQAKGGKYAKKAEKE